MKCYKRVQKNVQEECPAPSFVLVHTKCKNCDQVRLHSSLVLNINTPTLGREREQPESPRINIT